MTIKALVLDFGNVVGHFSYQPILDRLAPHTDLGSEDLLALYASSTLVDRYERGAITTAEFRVEAKRLGRLRCDDAHFDHAFSDIFWVNEALCARLPELARRYTLLLLSNTNDLHARQFLKQFRKPLAHFKHLVLSHQVGARKPECAIYEHTARLAGCLPHEILFLDDIEANVAGARACGWQGLVFTGIDVLQKVLQTNGDAFVSESLRSPGERQ